LNSRAAHPLFLAQGKDYRGLRTASRTGPHAAMPKAIAITGMSDRDPVDQVIAIKRNQRSPCTALRKPRTTPGGQPWYSPLAILTALTLRAVFRLALRQTEGMIGLVIHLLGLVLAVPDYSTLSRIRPAGTAWQV